MARINAQIVGEVCYREGDGVALAIPRGPCEVEIGELDVTISWVDGEADGNAAMPKSDYETYVAKGALVVD